MPRTASGADPIVSSYSVSIVPVEELQPYGRNARTHGDFQVDQLVALIKEFGWTVPVLAEINGDGTIIAGHGRRLAALKIYAEGGTIRLPDGRPLPPGTIPAIDCTGWSEEQRRTYILADNQVALNAGWDEALLKLEITDLRDEGAELSVIGFSADDLADLLKVTEPPQPPSGFPSFNETITTEHQCPKCGYAWSGKSS